MSDVLFADDDEGIRLMVADVLRTGGHAVRLASGGAAALDEVRRSSPDLVILDWRMGKPDGIEVCREIKQDPRLAHLPVLILTGQGELEDRLAGFDAGADDYLAKPFDPRELLARAGALLRLSRTARDRNPTSGLPGGEALYAEIDRRRAEGAPFAVCYFDLDHFKPFADHFGFAVADDAIRDAGAAVTWVADGAPGSFVGHIGGDDFVLLCDPGDARRLAAQAQMRFANGLVSHLLPDAVKAGSYRAEDRYGVLRDFPLTRLSAAVVRIDPARWPGMDRLGEVVSAAKRRAKSEEGGGIDEVDLHP
ncbi:MAG: Diguanylate cyclase protein [Gemmatimonadetes bacterium]|nr:Diguanylate cyclase protein [Gemmatimonadota bacterium]